MAAVTKAKAMQRLQQLLDEASELRPEDGHSQRLQKWLRDVEISFYRIFGEYSRQYLQIPEGYTVTTNGIRSHLNRMISLLGSCLDEIRYFWDDGEIFPNNIVDEREISTVDSDRVHKTLGSNRVFVIHGHDDAARETIARFMEKLELDPVILHEQPNKGRTIIEKFEDYADVGFAVVLLTPDDVGAPAANTDELKPRARQNVILELGYFIGKLGRERVCALRKDGVETPSDYDGVVYTDLDDGGAWKIGLFKELQAAGFDVDANRALWS